MKRLFAYLLLAAGVVSIFTDCSNKNSRQACLHQVTMDLDKGNYDAVLQSACADSMQKGAANFGLAGFDVKDVVNRLIDTGVVGGQTSTSDLTVYMNSLIGIVTPTTLAYIDASKTEYDIVCDTTPTVESAWKDANFYEGVVDSMKALSLLKTVIDSDGLGKMSSCDINVNNVPDEVDAITCALIASTVINNEAPAAHCTGATYAPLAPVEIGLKAANGTIVPGTYSGLTITIDGTPSACPATYKKLLYKDSSGGFRVATTSSEVCTDTNSNQWPCPLSGPNVDLVATINQVLGSARNSLDNSLTGTGSSDVKTALQDIRGQACCGCTSSPCAPCTSTCTAESIADYLQTIRK